MDYLKYFWQGDKVRLRPVSVDEAENVYKNSLDSPSRQFLQLGIELPKSINEIKEIMGKYADCKDVNGIIIFTIETLDGENVGGISYHTRNRKNGTFSIGLIIDAVHRRKGYAEDAARILLRYGFHERRYQKCNSGCVHTNEASIGFHKKLGFVEEGLRRRQFYMNGQYYDDLLFGLTREEFDEGEKSR
jgi:RimJ/RimL family protein N-acetyltransferase